MARPLSPVFAEFAPAKVNLTLRVRGKRADGYHEIESLVAFADIGDDVTLTPGAALALEVDGPTSAAAGPADDNLILKAARHLAARIPKLTSGSFALTKRLPVAAGLGGGSADAAAALRLLARANGLALDDSRLMEAARQTGADVPVCLDPRARVMRGVGDVLSEPVGLPLFPAVLVNPRVVLATKDVFAAFDRLPRPAQHALTTPPSSPSPASTGSPAFAGGDNAKLIARVKSTTNDLQPAAVSLQPVIADVLAALSSFDGCTLWRMSGSGATCFGLFGAQGAANDAARRLDAAHPDWWVRRVTLG